MELLAAIVWQWSYWMFDRFVAGHLNFLTGYVCLFALGLSFGLDFYANSFKLVANFVDSFIVLRLFGWLVACVPSTMRIGYCVIGYWTSINSSSTCFGFDSSVTELLGLVVLLRNWYLGSRLLLSACILCGRSDLSWPLLTIDSKLIGCLFLWTFLLSFEHLHDGLIYFVSIRFLFSFFLDHYLSPFVVDGAHVFNC